MVSLVAGSRLETVGGTAITNPKNCKRRAVVVCEKAKV